MEEKRGLLTYFTGIARLIVFIVLLAIITFFVVRWIRARQDTRVAQQAAQGQGTRAEAKDESKNEKSGAPVTGDQRDENESNAATNGGAPAVEVPGGVADSDIPSSGPRSVPNAGIESSLALTALMISLTTYSFVRFAQSRTLMTESQ